MLNQKRTNLLLTVATTLLITGCGKGRSDFSGYIDTDMTYLSSSYSGRLQKLDVQRGSLVEASQILFQVDPTYESLTAAIDQSNVAALLSELAQVKDQIIYAKQRLSREQKMRKTEASSKDDVELAQKNLDVLNNQLKSLEARIAASKGTTERTLWQKAQKYGVAESSGLVFDTFMMPGEYVQAGQPVVALITPESLKVTFFVNEPELAALKLGQKVNISSDGMTKPLRGTIDFISNRAEYTPPVIFSREERSKLVFKVVARPESPDLQSVHLGQPVTVSITND